ncbi:MAG: response regulator [Actinomycetota bacterium]
MRLILAEDSALLRESMAAALESAGFEVVGQAGDAEQLLELVARQEPNVVITDIRMPPTFTEEGLRAAKRIRAEHPGVGVLVLSQHLQTAYAVKLLEEGAERLGYLLKDRVSRLGQLEDAVRRIDRGETVIDADIVARLVGRQRKRGPLEELSEREREVLGLMAEGRSNEGISHGLFLSERTIETHISNIFVKLGLTDTPKDHRRVLAVLTFLRS